MEQGNAGLVFPFRETDLLNCIHASNTFTAMEDDCSAAGLMTAPRILKDLFTPLIGGAAARRRDDDGCADPGSRGEHL